jgi:hypothetical protein
VLEGLQTFPDVVPDDLASLGGEFAQPELSLR